MSRQLGRFSFASIAGLSLVIVSPTHAADSATVERAQDSHMVQRLEAIRPRLSPRRASNEKQIAPTFVGALQPAAAFPEAIGERNEPKLSRNFRNEIESLRVRAKAEGFLTVEEDLQSGIAIAQPGQRLDAFLLLATLYMAHGLHAEALSVIDEIEGASTHADFALLSGIARFKMGRLQDAVSTFSEDTLRGNAEASSWRGIANARRGAFKAAAADLFETPVRVLPFEKDASAFLLAKAETAMALAEHAIARDALGGLKHAGLVDRQRAERSFLESRLMLSQNRSEPGRRLLQQIVRSGPAPFANMAAVELLNDSFSRGTLDPGQAVDRTNSLMLTWRGGAFERRALAFSALMHDATGDTAAAYRARRQILDGFPDADAAKAAEQQMRADLATLLERGELSPLSAAQIFYENIDLAPPGREGDELIRGIADKLVGLDLVAQAAELLHHQTFERLRGANRSRLAADLAQLYVIDGKPTMALQVLRSTRHARLPDGINDQRRWIEARALIVTGNGNAALALLIKDRSVEGAKLRGEVYWEAQEWALAGDAFAAAAALPPKVEEPLDRDQSVLVLRAASAYGLAGAQSELRGLGSTASGMLADTDANHLLEGLAFGGLAENPIAFRDAYRAFFGDAATAS